VKTLDRYMLRELVVPFIIGTLAVVLMFQANLLIFILKTSPPQAVPIAAIMQMVMYKTPSFLIMTLPVGMSLAASLAISRLTRETELTAMRSAGAPILRVVVPVALFGVMVAFGNFYIAEKLVPPSEKRFNRLATEKAIMGAVPEFKSNVTFNLGNYSGNFGTVQRDKESTHINFTDVILYERPRSKEYHIHTADTGEYRNGFFVLRDAKTWVFKGDTVVGFESGKPVEINERVAIQDVFQSQTIEEQTAEELKRSIAEGRKIGRDMTYQEVSYHTRFSVPAACFIFAIVAPVFAVQFARSGAFLGVLLSIILVFLYYNVYVISTEIFGRNGILSPIISAWLPNVIFVVLGIIGIRRLE
jgi:LPS export ABC transporter permease LptG